MMRQMMDNPELLRSLMMQNPQMRELIDSNPQLSHVLNDPALMRQAMETARNPEAMRQMQRSNVRNPPTHHPPTHPPAGWIEEEEAVRTRCCMLRKELSFLTYLPTTHPPMYSSSFKPPPSPLPTHP